MKHYECAICYAVNHANRLQCRSCGTTPAQYSPVAKACNYRLVETIQAIGCDHVIASHARVYFRTVPADYYAFE